METPAKILTPIEAGRRIKLRGERVAICDINEDEVDPSGLILPGSATRGYLICVVASVGDGVLPNETLPRVMWPVVGDHVLIQMNPMMTKGASQLIAGVPMFIVHQADCIARIRGKSVTVETFEPLGRWVLLRAEFARMAGLLELPDPTHMLATAVPTTFFIEKAGTAASLGIDTGHQVYIDKTRANPLKMGGKNFAYIDRDSIVGVHEEITG